jgi:Uri superfamily endonuclease
MNLGLLNMLPQVGVYTLIIHLPAKICIKVGSLGEKQFPKGYYAYTGSALGSGASSLRKRVARHLQKKKNKSEKRFVLQKLRWHIDFLLANEDVRLEAVIAASTSQKKECQVNKHIKTRCDAKVLAPRFGASDCKQKCVSHLLYLGKENKKKLMKRIYEETCGKTTVIDFY